MLHKVLILVNCLIATIILGVVALYLFFLPPSINSQALADKATPALWRIRVTATVSGEFQDGASVYRDKTVRIREGNGFAINDSGSVVTAAHLADPVYFLANHLNELAQDNKWPISIEETQFKYEALNLADENYDAEYILNCVYGLGSQTGASTGIVVLESMFQSSTTGKKVQLLYSNRDLDFSILRFSGSTDHFVPLDISRGLPSGAALIRISLEGSFDPSTLSSDFKTGRLSQAYIVNLLWFNTTSLTASGLATVKGNSGSPILNSYGYAAGMVVSINGDMTYLVPAECITEAHTAFDQPSLASAAPH